jgi:signal transduction protein with GAF and PtsI domain
MKFQYFDRNYRFFQEVLMKKSIIMISLFLSAATGIPSAFAQNISQATVDQLLKTKAALAALAQTKANIYSKDILDEARTSITKAQERIDAKKEKAALESLEMAQTLMNYARVKSEEREAAEKTAVTRAKLEKLQKNLEDILSGKEGAQ